MTTRLQKFLIGVALIQMSIFLGSYIMPSTHGQWWGFPVFINFMVLGVVGVLFLLAAFTGD